MTSKNVLDCATAEREVRALFAEKSPLTLLRDVCASATDRALVRARCNVRDTAGSIFFFPFATRRFVVGKGKGRKNERERKKVRSGLHCAVRFICNSPTFPSPPSFPFCFPPFLSVSVLCCAQRKQKMSGATEVCRLFRNTGACKFGNVPLLPFPLVFFFFLCGCTWLRALRMLCQGFVAARFLTKPMLDSYLLSGSQCKYEHSSGDPIVGPSTRKSRGACRQFPTGECKYGDQCR